MNEGKAAREGRKIKRIAYAVSLVFAVFVGIAGEPATRYVLVQFFNGLSIAVPTWILLLLSIFIGGFCVGLVGFIIASALLPPLLNRSVRKQWTIWREFPWRKKVVFVMGLICVLAAGAMLTASAIFLSAFIVGSFFAAIMGAFVALAIAGMELEAFLRYFDQEAETPLLTNKTGFFVKTLFNIIGGILVCINALALSLLSAAALFFLLTNPWIGMAVMPAFILALCLSSTTFITRLTYSWQRVNQVFGNFGVCVGNAIGQRYFGQPALDRVNKTVGDDHSSTTKEGVKADHWHRQLKPFLHIIIFFRSIAWGAGNAFGMVLFANMLIIAGLAIPPGFAILTIAVGVLSFISALVMSGSFMRKEFRETIKTLTNDTDPRQQLPNISLQALPTEKHNLARTRVYSKENQVSELPAQLLDDVTPQAVVPLSTALAH